LREKAGGMTLPSMMITSLQGLQRAERQFERSAERVASATTEDSVTISPEARAGARPDLVAETVSTIKAVAAYRANLKVLQTEQEMSPVDLIR
jgi:hypothetical protein